MKAQTKTLWELNSLTDRKKYPSLTFRRWNLRARTWINACTSAFWWMRQSEIAMGNCIFTNPVKKKQKEASIKALGETFRNTDIDNGQKAQNPPLPPVAFLKASLWSLLLCHLKHSIQDARIYIISLSQGNEPWQLVPERQCIDSSLTRTEHRMKNLLRAWRVDYLKFDDMQ